jgi:hypothetical protein
MQSIPVIIEDQVFLGSPKVSGADNHAHTPERLNPGILLLYRNCVFDARGASEALKFSRHWDIRVEDSVIIGGVEDCLDIVRGGNLTFERVTFTRNGAKQDVTLKGGALNISFIDCPGLRKIVLGDYTKYDPKAVLPDGTVKRITPFSLPRPPVRNVTVESAETVEVLQLHAHRPKGNVKVTNLSWLVAPYFWVRSMFKETNPAPDEEFKLDVREV